MTNDQRIAEIAARCEAATPGPWDDKLTAVYKDETAIRICGEFYNFDADAFFVAQARQDIPYLLAQLAKYDEIAAEYGIDGKTMLTLAESQIETAKENIVLREHLKAEREKGCWACHDARRTGYTKMGSRIYIEKNEDCYAISDRLGNSVEVYYCPMCGRSLKEKHNE